MRVGRSFQHRYFLVFSLDCRVAVCDRDQRGITGFAPDGPTVSFPFFPLPHPSGSPSLSSLFQIVLCALPTTPGPIHPFVTPRHSHHQFGRSTQQRRGPKRGPHVPKQPNRRTWVRINAYQSLDRYRTASYEMPPKKKHRFYRVRFMNHRTWF